MTSQPQTKTFSDPLPPETKNGTGSAELASGPGFSAHNTTLRGKGGVWTKI